MRRLITGLALVLAVILGGSGRASAQGYMQPEDAMKVLDGLWAKAYVECDAKTWDEILGSDLTFIHNNGMVDDKAMQMASVKACGIESLKSQVTSATLYSDDTVVLVGALQGKVKGGDVTFDLLYTRVYVKRLERWSLVAHQSTNAPKKTP